MLSRRSLFTTLAGAAGVLAIHEERALAASPPPPRGPRAAYFPNFVLQTHDGASVRFYDDLIRGRIVAINMMYADCEGICPAMTGNLLKVQRALGDRVGRDIFMYSISLQPANDTPAVLNTYVQHHGIGPGWRFLTGRPDEIEVLRRKLGFVDPDPVLDRDKTNHTGVVLFGNEARDSWAACPALAPADQIVRSILLMDLPRLEGRT